MSQNPPPFQAPSPPPSPLDNHDHQFQMLEKSSNYIWTEQSKILSKLHEYEFQLMSMNIRSLNRHSIELQALLDQYKPQFVCLSEIWRPYGPGKILNGYQPIIEMGSFR